MKLTSLPLRQIARDFPGATSILHLENNALFSHIDGRWGGSCNG